ncbi:MAG: branched-chain amino acid ABC transporter permease [Dehalococcoidia bacterium]
MEFDVIIGNAFRSGLGPQAAIFALAAIGLNVHFGYAGLVNFGQVGFMMLGAYGMAVVVATWGGPLWLGIPFGLGLCVAFALALGIPTLRLRSDYFAITTIAAAEILRILIRSSHATDLTGGPFGLQAIAGDFYDLSPIPDGRYGIGTFSYNATQVWLLIVAWILVALCAALVLFLVRSPWGRVVRAIREDEEAVRSLGKNTVSYKMQALIIGGLIGGLAGVVDAIQQSGVGSENFEPQVTFFAYAALILGGTATTAGPIVGAVLFWFLREATESFTRELSSQDWLPGFLDFMDGSEGAISIALTGLGLILLITYRPQGIFGKREELQLDV